jgi:hypothetical protein
MVVDYCFKHALLVFWVFENSNWKSSFHEKYVLFISIFI